jgi:hypothetical protein
MDISSLLIDPYHMAFDADSCPHGHLDRISAVTDLLHMGENIFWENTEGGGGKTSDKRPCPKVSQLKTGMMFLVLRDKRL